MCAFLFFLSLSLSQSGGGGAAIAGDKSGGPRVPADAAAKAARLGCPSRLVLRTRPVCVGNEEEESGRERESCGYN